MNYFTGAFQRLDPNYINRLPFHFSLFGLLFNVSFPEGFGYWREGFSLPVPSLLKSPKCIPTHVYNVFSFQDNDSGTVGRKCFFDDEGKVNKN